MYTIKTLPLHERNEIIQRAIKSSKKTFTFYEYQSKQTDLPIIRVDLQLPIYRMANYRTRIDQLKYIHENNKSHDYFTTGQENESVQKTQHDILIKFAKQEKGSVRSIYEEFLTTDQQEPLLITTGGIIVNGNRRLATMRELYSEKPRERHNFSHVDCAVLPECVTASDIKEIEVRLQMQPETKLPYIWINESIAIKEFLQSGKKIDHIAELMKKKTKEINIKARALTEADIYLKDWLNAPEEYQHIELNEQNFNDLAKALNGIQGDELEIRRRFAWSIISNSKKLGTRSYAYNFSFGNRANDVVKQLSTSLEEDIKKQTLKITKKEKQPELLIDIEEPSNLQPLISIFDDKETREKASECLIKTCENISELDRQGEISRQALDCVESANTKLQQVDLSKADPATFSAISNQLTSIIDKAQKIQSMLKTHSKANK